MYPKGTEKLDITYSLYQSQQKQYDQNQEEYFLAKKFNMFGVNVLGMTLEEVENFFCIENLSFETHITKDYFKQLFDQYQNVRLFSWVEDVRKEFKGLQNAEIINLIPSQIVQSSEFTEEEYNTLVKLFDEKIASQTEIKKATKVFEEIFSDRQIHLKLRNRLIESFLYASDSKFYDKKVYLSIMQLLFKEQDETKQIGFIFDIFTKYSKSGVMTNYQIQDVLSAFQIKLNYNKQDVLQELNQIKSLDKKTFVEQFSKFLSHQTQFGKIKNILNIELGVRPDYSVQEQDVIFNTMDWQYDLVEYARENMQKGDKFYVMNKKFYDDWLEFTHSKKSRNDQRSPKCIDNEILFESKDSYKLKELRLNDNIVVVPPRVWKAFTQWYGYSKPIKRKVIQYTADQDDTLLIEGRKSNNIKNKLPEKMILELEIDSIYIKYGTIQENGNKSKDLSDGNISRKLTLFDLKEKLCKHFKIEDITKAQLWMKDTLIQGEILASIVEDNKEIKNGSKFYIEKQLENQRWPSDEKILKAKSKNQIYEIKTKGLFNRGNTCFINAIVQCIANSPFFKEFFLQHLFYPKDKQLIDYKNQINPDNPQGYKGDIVIAFAKLIEDMFTSSMACYKTPKKFKQAMGKHHEQFSGFQQQDAQEFLVTLLDSLHEEMNIRMEKPYIENPNSQGRNEVELMYEYWSNFLHRNWSFIVFVFYGQMKSYLKCCECGNERITFDVFSNLSLPLPDSSLMTLNFIIYLLPQEIKLMLLNQGDLCQPNIDLQRKQSLNFDIYENNLLVLTKEKPIRFSINISPQALLGDVYQHLKKNFENLDLLDQQLNYTQLMYYLYSDKGQKITHVLSPQIKLNMIVENTDIYAVELLNQQGKQRIQEFYQENWADVKIAMPNALLQFQNEYQMPDQEDRGFRDYTANKKQQTPEVIKEVFGQEDIAQSVIIAEEIKQEPTEESKPEPLEKLQIEGEHPLELLQGMSNTSANDQEIQQITQIIKVQNIQHMQQTKNGKSDMHGGNIGNKKSDQQKENAIAKSNEEIKEGAVNDFDFDLKRSQDQTITKESKNGNSFKVEKAKNIDEIMENKEESKEVDSKVDKETNRPRSRGFKQFQQIQKEPLLLNLYDYFDKYQFKQSCGQEGDYNHYQNQMINKRPEHQYDQKIIKPSEFLIFIVNRKIIQKQSYFINKYETQLFGHPFIILVNQETTGRQLYEEIWMKVRFMLNLSQWQYYSDRSKLWWTLWDDESQIYDFDTAYQPFILKYVKSMTFDGQTCSVCRWYDKCFGCPITPEKKPINKILLDHSYIAIDWNLDFLQQYYQEGCFKPFEHKSIKENQLALQKEMSIKDCLQLFASVEEISNLEGLRCDKCNQATNHVRKISISKLPPILIIQLKRFKIVNKTKKKVHQFVNYPLYDLDIREFLSNPQLYEHLPSNTYTYDLYGVVNHYGIINGGHYTSFIKNELTNNWLQYDDTSVKDIPESRIRSEYAYILFYKRKDIQDKPLSQFYPSIGKEGVFRGKPVRINKKNSQKLYGYIWDYNETKSSPYHIKLNNSNMDFFTTYPFFPFTRYRSDFLQLDDAKDDLAEIQQKYKAKYEESRKERPSSEKDKKKKEKKEDSNCKMF